MLKVVQVTTQINYYMVNLSNTVPPLIHKWSKAISLMNPKLMADFYCENDVSRLSRHLQSALRNRQETNFKIL